jgi:HAD superfamily hydrolase (TIGR01509 family)
MSADQVRAAGLYEGFDPVLLSCEIHLAKPDPAVYEYALKALGLPGNEVLFIDDQQRFMPPEHFGMATVLAVSPQQIVDDVTALIKKENNLTLG